MKEGNGKQQAAEDFVSEEAVCGVGPLALCWHDLCKASLGKISAKDLQEESLSKISVEAPSKSFCVGNPQEKCGTPIPGTSFCASLRNRNAHEHVTIAILCGNLQGKCRTHMRTPRLHTGPQHLP